MTDLEPLGSNVQSVLAKLVAQEVDRKLGSHEKKLRSVADEIAAQNERSLKTVASELAGGLRAEAKAAAEQVVEEKVAPTLEQHGGQLAAQAKGMEEIKKEQDLIMEDNAAIHIAQRKTDATLQTVLKASEDQAKALAESRRENAASQSAILDAIQSRNR